MKQCTVCKKTKSLDEFTFLKRGDQNRFPYCKPCRADDGRRRYQENPIGNAKYQRVRRSNPLVLDRERETTLRRQYGLEIGGYARLLKEQGGGCGVCGQPPTDKALAVDHDHVTGRIRGLLCTPCNTALGFLKDDPQRIRKLLQWIED